MSDYISRDAALKAVEETWDGCCSEYPAREIINETQRAIDNIDSMPLGSLAKFIFENLDPRVDCKTCKTNNPNHDSMDCIYDGCPHMNEEQTFEALKKWMEEQNDPHM